MNGQNAPGFKDATGVNPIVKSVDVTMPTEQARAFTSKTLDTIWKEDENVQAVQKEDITLEVPIEGSTTEPEQVSAPVGELPVNLLGTIPADVLLNKPAATAASAENAPNEKGDAVATANSEEPVPADIANNPPAAHRWAKLTSEKAQLKKRVAELESRIESEKKELQDEVESSRRVLSEYEEKLGRYNITELNSFKQAYDMPLTSKFTQVIATLSKHFGGDAEKARALASHVLNPESDRTTLLAELDIPTQVRVNSMLASIDDLNSERQAKIDSWKESLEVYREQEERQGLTRMSTTIAKDAADAVSSLVEEGNYLFKISQVDEDWNNGVAKRIDTVKAILKTGNPGEVAKYVADGVTAGTYRDLYEYEKARADKLDAELAKRVKARPAVGGSGPAVLGQQVPKTPVVKSEPKGASKVLDRIWGAEE